MFLMPLGLFFDFMDGKVARWRKKSSLMGQELDSLADLVRIYSHKPETSVNESLDLLRSRSRRLSICCWTSNPSRPLPPYILRPLRPD